MGDTDKTATLSLKVTPETQKKLKIVSTLTGESMADMIKENFPVEAALSLEMAEMDRTELQTIE